MKTSIISNQAGTCRKEITACLLLVFYFQVLAIRAKDHVVPVNSSALTIGANYGGGVDPGDTITLVGGTRARVILQDLQGTAQQPIVVRNDPTGNKRVTIDGKGSGYALLLQRSHYVVVDGSANPGFTYGIHVTTSVSGTTALFKVKQRNTYITARYLEVSGGGERAKIGIDVNDHDTKKANYPGYWNEGHHFEYNYVHDVGTEGFYVGPNNADDSEPSLRNIQINHNLVVNSGWDGINLKDAIQGNNRIHHNTVKNAGYLVTQGTAQHTGIAVLNSTASVYNNRIENAYGDGLRFAGTLRPGLTASVYNNVITDPGQLGVSGTQRGIFINSSYGDAPIYNNTVARAPGAGIDGRASGAIRDNLLAGCGAINAVGMTKVNNYEGTVASVKFVDAVAGDFHLTSDSPARNAGSSQGFPPFDFDDVSRPQEGAADQGAYEYVPPPKPAAPSNLSATTVSSSRIDLSWTDNASDETAFRIQRKTGEGGTYSLIATVGANVTSYSDTGLSASTTYYYRVRASNANGTSAWSNEASATTSGLPPTAPSGLVATVVSSSQINLVWTDNASNETEFEIQRQTTGSFSTIATVGANTTTFNNTGLSASTTYTYRVRARNANGDSVWSNEASDTTQSEGGGGGITVTASAHDGNVPENTLDGDLGTRWSAEGDGQWIKFDLGSIKTLTAVRIAFYQGASRVSYFDIETSTDNATWTAALMGGQSSGATTALEIFDVANRAARYVRITGHGNSNNLWNSYTVVEIVTVAATASADDGNVPENTLDGDLGTRWSADGDGQWIKFDLGMAQTLTAIEIAFYQGDQRVSYFDVETSTDNVSWTAVLTGGQSSGTTTALESFDLANSTPRYIRITGHGNSVNLWNSYTEVQLGTVVATATASADDGNVPENTLDGDLGTRWSASGDGQWIKFDLGSPRTVATVQIAFYLGNQRVSYFDIATSTDNVNWTSVLTGGQSSGTSTALETFNVTSSTARYVRITGHGNSVNLWNSYTEVEIVTVAAAPIGTTMHVGSLTATTVNAGKGQKRGQVEVVIKDSLGNPVASATVIGTFSGAFNETGSAVTNSDGQAVITTTATASGAAQFTFCVDNVTHATHTYDSAANVATCASN